MTAALLVGRQRKQEEAAGATPHLQASNITPTHFAQNYPFLFQRCNTPIGTDKQSPLFPWKHEFMKQIRAEQTQHEDRQRAKTS